MNKRKSRSVLSDEQENNSVSLRYDAFILSLWASKACCSTGGIENDRGNCFNAYFGSYDSAKESLRSGYEDYCNKTLVQKNFLLTTLIQSFSTPPACNQKNQNYNWKITLCGPNMDTCKGCFLLFYEVSQCEGQDLESVEALPKWKRIYDGCKYQTRI